MNVSTDGQKLADAWREWLHTQEGRGCDDAETLRATEYPNAYLRNRLWRAFMAGAKAAEKLGGEV